MKRLGLLGVVLLLSTSVDATEKPSSHVVEMWEKCAVSHVLGGPAPIIITLVLFENGDVEYSEASNHRYRAAVPPSEVILVCKNLVTPVLEQTKVLEPLLEDQHDTERFYVSVEDRSVEFPRFGYRPVVDPQGLPDAKEQDELSPFVKKLLRDVDDWSNNLFGERHKHRFLRQVE